MRLGTVARWDNKEDRTQLFICHNLSQSLYQLSLNIDPYAILCITFSEVSILVTCFINVMLLSDIKLNGTEFTLSLNIVV